MYAWGLEFEGFALKPSKHGCKIVGQRRLRILGRGMGYMNQRSRGHHAPHDFIGDTACFPSVNKTVFSMDR